MPGPLCCGWLVGSTTENMRNGHISPECSGCCRRQALVACATHSFIGVHPPCIGIGGVDRGRRDHRGMGDGWLVPHGRAVNTHDTFVGILADERLQFSFAIGCGIAHAFAGKIPVTGQILDVRPPCLIVMLKFGEPLSGGWIRRKGPHLAHPIRKVVETVGLDHHGTWITSGPHGVGDL